ncbi:MAG: hypothetical protein P8X39_10900 [Desulfofustis sp.]
MGFTLFVNIGIIVLSTFGFISTTYGGRLADMPDHLENRIFAIGFGLAGLVATVTVLVFSSAICTFLLVNILVYLNIL